MSNEKIAVKVDLEKLKINRPDVNNAYKEFVEGKQLQFLRKDHPLIKECAPNYWEKKNISTVCHEDFFIYNWIFAIEILLGFTTIAKYHTGVPDIVIRPTQNSKMTQILFDMHLMLEETYNRNDKDFWDSHKSINYGAEVKVHGSEWDHEQKSGSLATHLVICYFYNPKKHPKDKNGDYIPVLYFELDENDKNMRVITTPMDEFDMKCIEFASELMNEGCITKTKSDLLAHARLIITLLRPYYYEITSRSSKIVRTWCRVRAYFASVVNSNGKNPMCYSPSLPCIDIMTDEEINNVDPIVLCESSEITRLRIKEEEERPNRSCSIYADEKKLKDFALEFVELFLQQAHNLKNNCCPPEEKFDADEYLIWRIFRHEGQWTIQLCAKPGCDSSERVRKFFESHCHQKGLV